MLSNITDSIKSKMRANLLSREDSPLFLFKEAVSQYFLKKGFVVSLPKVPVVTVQQNFDDLLIPEDHVSRSPKDTYYVDDNNLLRTHTSAHQSEMLAKGRKKFVVIADCYRRDSIDAFHYPVFHQVEGVCLKDDWTREEAEKDIKNTLEDMMKYLLQDQDMKFRWIEAYFPFTKPSFELEIFYRGEWLEVLGCGLVENKIIENARLSEKTHGWAFGIGIERISMIRFKIPDIRLFWSDDQRFRSQFKGKSWFDDFQFEEYSKHPACYKDISFWLNPDFNENDFMEVVRNLGGDLIEQVYMFDEFSKDGQTSRAYKITYRSMDRSLTNDEINGIQELIRSHTSALGVTLR